MHSSSPRPNLCHIDWQALLPSRCEPPVIDQQAEGRLKAVCAAANMRMQAAAPSCSQRRATRCSDGKVRHGRLRASEDGERPGVLVREGVCLCVGSVRRETSVMDRSSAESLYLETRGLGVMARGLLVGVTCDMFLSIFRRDRDTVKNKIFFEERKIFDLACCGSDRPCRPVTRHRPFSRATSC